MKTLRFEQSPERDEIDVYRGKTWKGWLDTKKRRFYPADEAIYSIDELKQVIEKLGGNA